MRVAIRSSNSAAEKEIGDGHQHALKAINLAIKDRNGLVLGAAQGLRNELRQNAIRVVLEKLTPIKVKHLAGHSLQDEPLWEDVMADALHIVCPHCDASNRMPRERLRDGAKCGSCHRRLFEGRPAALKQRRSVRQARKA
jgi:hypothetical protein